MIDCIVVGSGPSGSQAAEALVEKGVRVLMLDGGMTDSRGYAGQVPDRPFLSVRTTDPDQRKYFLGLDFEGIPDGPIRSGSTMSAPRQYVTAGVERWSPSTGEGFRQLESLALGGLGAAWGLGCFVMSDAELDAIGLDRSSIFASYERVARRVGVSGSEDDGSAHYRRGLKNVQPPLELDESAEKLLATYERRRAKLNARGIYLGRTMLAMLSRAQDGRSANAYHDMDFWSDHGESAYRPAITVRRLSGNSLFEYRGQSLVTRFEESADRVRVEYLDMTAGERRTAEARRLILAAGVFGTSRIVLRSVAPTASVPVLSNPYFYVVCVRPGLLGRELRDRRHSMGQLVMLHDEGRDGSHVPVASLLSYRSFLLHRLVREAPVAAPQARVIMQYLQSALTVAGVFHPDYPGGHKRMTLEEDSASPTGDRLKVEYRLSDDQSLRVRRNHAALLGGLRSLNCIPVRSVDPGHGASVHYGGALPFDRSRSNGLSADPASGRSNGTRNVLVADGSPFRVVPAKGITLTLMAYADWVASRAWD